MNLCELVRKEFAHDREFCLYPLRFHDGLVQACTIAYNRAITINLRFFNDNYEFQVWLDTETNIIIYQPSGKNEKCFMMRDFVYELFKHNKEAALIMLYSLFFKVKKLIEAAYDAAEAAAEAVYEAYEAVYEAHEAVYEAYEAAEAAYEACEAYDAAEAYEAAEAAYEAYEACEAYEAYEAYDAAAYDAAAYDAAKKYIRKALRKIFRFRKALIKEVE